VPLQPTSDLVAVNFIRSLVGIVAARVATTLPKDDEAIEDGFLVVTAIPGGSPGVYVALRSPVVNLTSWAVNRTSGKPPWGRANQILETVYMALINKPALPRKLVFTEGDYEDAQILSAYLLTEPARVPGDEGSYARYTTEMMLHWRLT